VSTNDWSEGKLENAARGVPAKVTDCSNWESDLPSEAWSEGNLESLARTVPGLVTDCAVWDAEPAVWLELVVRFEVNADLEAVRTATAQLINTLKRMAPDLRLTYDSNRSHVNGEGDIVVALKPGNRDVNPAKMKHFLGQIRAATTSSRELTPIRMAELRGAPAL